MPIELEIEQPVPLLSHYLSMSHLNRPKDFKTMVDLNWDLDRRNNLTFLTISNFDITKPRMFKLDNILGL